MGDGGRRWDNGNPRLSGGLFGLGGVLWRLIWCVSFWLGVGDLEGVLSEVLRSRVFWDTKMEEEGRRRWRTGWRDGSRVGAQVGCRSERIT